VSGGWQTRSLELSGKAKTIELPNGGLALLEAIAQALAAVTTEDAAGWFAHAGYWPKDQP
jgi:hypothetical protein